MRVKLPVLRPKALKPNVTRAPSNNNFGIPETDSGGHEAETRSRETERSVHRIHDTLETCSQSVLRSLVAPSGEGPTDELIFSYALINKPWTCQEIPRQATEPKICSSGDTP